LKLPLEISVSKSEYWWQGVRRRYLYQRKMFQTHYNDYGIDPCCQLFYHSWLNFKKQIPEYTGDADEGVIYCPDCLPGWIVRKRDWLPNAMGMFES